MDACSFCENKPQYRDCHTGQYICLEHARMEVTAARRQPTIRPLTIRPALASDRLQVEALSRYFWDETEVDCFDRQYDVSTCPAFLVCDGEQAVGLAAYAVEAGWDAMVLVMLNVLPALALYQRCGLYITEVVPGRITEHHGGVLPGFAGIPVRDEIRLEYRLTA